MKFTLFVTLLTSVQGFLWPPNLPKIPVDNVKNVLSNTPTEMNGKGFDICDFLHNVNMQQGLEECQQTVSSNSHATSFIQSIHDTLDKIHTDGGYFVVKAISAGLPYVDSIGHRILHANDVFINQVLNTEGMPHEIKAKIILTAIQVSQAGDNFGGVLLKLYYDIVERCFH